MFLNKKNDGKFLKKNKTSNKNKPKMSCRNIGIYSSSAQTFIALHPLLISPDYDLAKRKVVKKTPLKRSNAIYIVNGHYVTIQNGKPVTICKVETPSFNY